MTNAQSITPMIARSLILLAFWLPVTPLLAQRSIPAERFLHLLQSAEYRTLMNEAMVVRDTTYGKNFVIDWFIAKAIYCSDHHDRAGDWYRKIQQRYTLPGDFGQFLASEIADCDAQSATCPPVLDAPARHSTGAAQWVPLQPMVAGVHDKMGRMYECQTLIPEADFTEAQANVKKLLPVVPLGDTVALADLRTTLGSAYQADTSGQFIILSRPGYLDRASVRRASEKLAGAYAFFVRTYDFTPPPYYITAGLVNGNRELQALGEAVHGLHVPGHVLGYSSVADMAMFGSASSEAIATLYHELFHLLVRADAGDIPAWLDEGVASVYESPEDRIGELVGLYDYRNNFRLEMLRRAAENRSADLIIPSITTLMGYSWADFDGRPGANGCMPAVHYALAKHFALYMQETGKLYPMVKAFRHDVVWDADSIPVLLDNRALVEAVIGRTMAEVEMDFERWFKSRYGFRPRSPD